MSDTQISSRLTGSGADEPDLDKCAEMVAVCVCLQLRKATRSITQLFDERLRPSGVLSTQLPLLVTLALAEPATITHLAQELVMDRTSVTRHLAPLDKQGLVKIVPGEDRRTRQVSLTRQGREVVANAIPLWEEAQARVVETLGERRTQQLGENLAAAMLAAHHD